MDLFLGQPVYNYYILTFSTIIKNFSIIYLLRKSCLLVVGKEKAHFL